MEWIAIIIATAVASTSVMGPQPEERSDPKNKNAVNFPRINSYNTNRGVSVRPTSRKDRKYGKV